MHKIHICGIDEAGRGPLAGPVVAACVILPEDTNIFGYFINDYNISEQSKPIKLNLFDSIGSSIWSAHPLINDSKKLNVKKRELAFQMITQIAISIGVGYSTPAEIDLINIRQASLLAMKRALWQVNPEKKSILMIDGRDCLPEIEYEQYAVIGGDGKIAAISAASIVAKVLRDWMMISFSKIYKDMYFDKHKGYGTKLHLECLRKFGITPIHRQSFLKKFYAKEKL